ncbi:MAG: UDP-glucose 4-epimerase GalE [Phycisphaerae bacterium]
MHITVTGAAGYIGSHACLKLLDEGHQVHGLDNYSRSFERTVQALQRAGGDRFHFTRVELNDQHATTQALKLHATELVMHFAAFAVVPESVKCPLLYWHNNVGATVSLLNAMDAVDCGQLIFSSTCATYGEPAPEHIPISEDCPQRPTHAYGESKLACEHMMHAWVQSHALADRDRGVVFLRYFNVAGGDHLDRIGEDHDPETHLIPICLRAATGRHAPLVVHGNDYPTPDGTCIRDYVHVEDLVQAHIEAIKVIPRRDTLAMNVGTGVGASVLEVLRACSLAAGREVPFHVGARRDGDPPRLVSHPKKIVRLTNWRPARSSLEEIARSAWRWFAKEK